MQLKEGQECEEFVSALITNATDIPSGDSFVHVETLNQDTMGQLCPFPSYKPCLERVYRCRRTRPRISDAEAVS
jgi:hypothetical protein